MCQLLLLFLWHLLLLLLLLLLLHNLICGRKVPVSFSLRLFSCGRYQYVQQSYLNIYGPLVSGEDKSWDIRQILQQLTAIAAIGLE